MATDTAARSLRQALAYEPVVLKFGTSGRRGEVIHLTQLEIYINATAELEYLQSLPQAKGGIRKGDEFFFAYDLRPSSTRFVAEQGGRGELAQAIELAIRDAGMRPVNLGPLPTPALMSHAIARGCGSMMITGSHIPFDRNGYKTNSAKGELLKEDETPINARVEEVRQRLYTQVADASPFNAKGLLKASKPLGPIQTDARETYIRRYTEFFPANGLAGMRLLVYQHSAVGRDLLVEIVQRLGAEAIIAGRSDTFVPIDTEAIDAQQLVTMQKLLDEAAKGQSVDAVVSTDGDSDRPLILAVESGRVRFFGGDLVGMVVASYLGADAVVVPISCNDAIDRGSLKDKLEPKTRIGSPYVIAAMANAREKGRRAICGWEANGGFLTGSDITRDRRKLPALPTRDAILPILATLFAAREAKCSVAELFSRLPRRFSRAALLRNFPRPASTRIVQRYSPDDTKVIDVYFKTNGVELRDAAGTVLQRDSGPLLAVRDELSTFLTAADGFGEIQRLNYRDGVRVYFTNGDVAHVRPSGNADELRIYAVADTQGRADRIAELGVSEPDGILRRLEKTVSLAK